MSEQKSSALRIIVSSLGILIGLVGIINHGFFEIQQGNTISSGLIIQSVKEGNILGAPAGEEVLTIIPNLLISGICTVIISLLIIIWSGGFIHGKYGSTIFLILCILQSLAGGGLAQLVVVLLVWRASRISFTLSSRQRKFQDNKFLKMLSGFWLYLLITGIVLVFGATQIALFQSFPGVSDPKLSMLIGLIILVVGICVFILTMFAGFFHDIERQEIIKAI
jgi:hypothetical protein